MEDRYNDGAVLLGFAWAVLIEASIVTAFVMIF
jgi:hypothetical protein